jgi:hypothetical protein
MKTVITRKFLLLFPTFSGALIIMSCLFITMPGNALTRSKYFARTPEELHFLIK